MSLVRKTFKTLRQECALEPESSIVVACSGGADSVALLSYLNSRREKLKIARLGIYHLNHGLRGKEAIEDEEFIQKLASDLGLSFHLSREDVGTYASENGISIEMAGRKLRYKGLDALLDGEGYDLAALGHTASDNVEWILMSLIRGRAQPLLWGIPARRGRFIRPLIRCTRKEVISYLRSVHQTYREDSSNTSLTFERNRIRHLIIPLLREENPSIEETISRTLMLGDIEKAFQDSSAKQLLDEMLIKTGRGRKLDTSKLSRYNPVTQLHIIRLFVPWLSAHEALSIIPLKVAKGTTEIGSGCGERLFREYDCLVVEKDENQPVWKPVVLRDEVLLPYLGWRLRVYTSGAKNVKYESSDTVFFDSDCLESSLEVRPWHEGDRMVPFGRRSTVKVKRIFQDRKVPSRMRKYWPLVCKGEEIVWVAGIQRSNVAPVTDSTRNMTILTLLRGENGQ